MCYGVIPIAIVEKCAESNSPTDITSNEVIQESNRNNFDNLQKLVADKEDVIIGQKALIASLNETVDTDKELFIYKDDVISKQTDVISSLKNSLACGDIANVEDNDGIRDTFNRSKSSLESQGKNTSKDMELNNDTKEIQRLTSIAKSWRNDFENLEKKYKEVNARGNILEKRIDDQAMIISKADLDFQTKCVNAKVNAKDEVINNLKAILDLRKADSPRENGMFVAVPICLKESVTYPHYLP